MPDGTVTPREDPLLQSVARLAQETRAQPPSSPAARQTITDQFHSLLDDLYQIGWDYALGWQNEPPDEYLPERYRRRRAEILDQLETELAILAGEFRGSQDGSPQEADIVQRYGRVMEELFRIGHWSGEPDWDSQLPDALMPQVYKDYWHKRLHKTP